MPVSRVWLPLKAFSFAAVTMVVGAGLLAAADQVNAQLPFHAPSSDNRGKLLDRFCPEKNLGYDKVLAGEE